MLLHTTKSQVSAAHVDASRSLNKVILNSSHQEALPRLTTDLPKMNLLTITEASRYTVQMSTCQAPGWPLNLSILHRASSSTSVTSNPSVSESHKHFPRLTQIPTMTTLLVLPSTGFGTRCHPCHEQSRDHKKGITRYRRRTSRHQPQTSNINPAAPRLRNNLKQQQCGDQGPCTFQG